MKKVFLGGTCNNSMWREELVIPKLKIDYFNPVVPDWNEEAYQRELKERAFCDYCVYVLTAKMVGTYAVAEVVDDSNKRPEKTILVVLEDDDGNSFGLQELKSLGKVKEMVGRNGAAVFNTIDEMTNYLNDQGKE